MLYMKAPLHSLATLASLPKMVAVIVGAAIPKDTAMTLPFNLQVHKPGSEQLPFFYIYPLTKLHTPSPPSNSLSHFQK